MGRAAGPAHLCVESLPTTLWDLSKCAQPLRQCWAELTILLCKCFVVPQMEVNKWLLVIIYTVGPLDLWLAVRQPLC